MTKLTHFAQIESAYSHVVHSGILVHERSDRAAALPAGERQWQLLERAIVLLDRVLVLEYDGARRILVQLFTRVRLQIARIYVIVTVDDLLELAAADLRDSVLAQVRVDQVQTILGDSM